MPKFAVKFIAFDRPMEETFRGEKWTKELVTAELNKRCNTVVILEINEEPTPQKK
jgi:hypothetical protein